MLIYEYMRKNKSPWIHQLDRTREPIQIEKNENTDILIIGGGIAGTLTAYNILKSTDKNVILIDCNLIGHGATGHNAGQLTTYFERPLADIASEFGVELACRAQKDVESAWYILENIQKDINLKTPIYRFTGYAGMTELSQVLLHLTNNIIKYDGNINIEKMLISDNFKYLKDIPSIFSHLYEITEHKNILDLLETNNKDYIATLAYPKGATNSAKICEEIIIYLINKYQNRFNIYENTPANRIILENNNALTEIVLNKEDTETSNQEFNFTINSKKVILCTNGFEGFNIINNAGENIDTAFHHRVNGVVNFMSAYIDDTREEPVAISYFPKDSSISTTKSSITGDIYFYMTRRPHIHNGEEKGLISTGGPERALKEGEKYNRNNSCEEWAEKDINDFLKNNYAKHKGEDIVYDFCWHGLLGYTNTGLRMIGEEPLNKILMYNLGCNGIGIMPSIYGAERIAKILNNEKLGESIFDPRLNIDKEE